MQRDIVVKTSKTQWHRIHATYSFVLTTLDCPFNANQLDRLFGSKESRGSVFNKHLGQQTRPSFETIMEIDNEVAGTLRYYYSPLWLALFLLEAEKDDWTLLHNKLDLDVASTIFEDKRSDVGSFVLRKITRPIVTELRLRADAQSLACLITLLKFKLAKSGNVLVSMNDLQHAIVEHLVNLNATGYFTHNHHELTIFLVELLNRCQPFIATNKLKEFIEYGVDLVRYKRQLLGKLFQIGLRETYKGEGLRFLALVDMSNRELLIKEVNLLQQSAKSHDSIIIVKAPKSDFPLAANSERGLLWVISKINSARSKSGKIKRFIKHDELVLILRERAQFDVTTWSRLID
ncbi:hypothetical protein LHL20_20145 [Alteromonas sp. McT4-15]|uniref:hypothetical protein n=1 Tax=Alteromonas sp. McT4-15 TaxID=2881256 RepID=UPI001CF8789E|nr:hypothetical protein [Alteromonas sp. McT4-15]MCB4438543.1 hypothetical protein [Alteromonas sp. McT4-15]